MVLVLYGSDNYRRRCRPSHTTSERTESTWSCVTCDTSPRWPTPATSAGRPSSCIVAQPALSYAIRQLEDELDATLFNRTTRQVSLTPAGEFLKAEAARILAGVDDAERGVRRIAAGRSGLLRVGLTGTAAFSHLPRIARILRQELPGVAMEIQADMLTPRAMRAAAHRRAGRRGAASTCGRRRHRAAQHRRGTAGPRGVGRPPAGCRARGVVDRLAQRIVRRVLQPRLGGQRCGAAQLQARRVRAASRTCRTGYRRAAGTGAAGFGVAVVPASVRALPLQGLVFRDLADGGSVELALAWRRATVTIRSSMLSSTCCLRLSGWPSRPLLWRSCYENHCRRGDSVRHSRT